MLYNFLAVVARFFYSIIFNYKVVNKPENMDGPWILCANHTSNWDAITMSISTDRTVYNMGKKELWKNKLLAKILNHLKAFPVDRQKGNDMKSIRTAVNLLKEGKVLGIFPEGTRVKTIDIDNMKDGVGFLASRGNAKIYACHIDAEYKFRGKVVLTYKKVIDPKDYEDIKNSKERYDKITEDLFYGIYF